MASSWILTSLTRRLAHMNVSSAVTTIAAISKTTATATATTAAVVASASWKPAITIPFQTQIRCFAQKKKTKPPKKSKKDLQPVKEAYNEQHKEWVKFQQGLQVDGFDTGQTLAVTKSAMTGTKARGGRAVRKRLLKLTEPARLQLERDKLMENSAGGLFPPLRYHDDETMRLLNEAYANVPPRAGKRGTRHLKRMKEKYFLINKARSKQKFFKKRAHLKRMRKRSQVITDVLQTKEDAQIIVDREQNYQRLVMDRWAETVLKQQQLQQLKQYTKKNASN